MARTRRLVIVMFSGVRSAHYSNLIAYRYSAFLRPFSTYADERYLLLTFDVYLPRLVSAFSPFSFHSFSTNIMPVVFGVLLGVSACCPHPPTHRIVQTSIFYPFVSSFHLSAILCFTFTVLLSLFNAISYH